MQDRNYYTKQRDKYRPRKIKIIFILESPPVSGRYFYTETGQVLESLFSVMMETLFGMSHQKLKDKQEGLKMFREAGYFLVDATYVPVNKLNERLKEETILRDYPVLREELKYLIERYGDKRTKIVLVKKNICRLLEAPLLEQGFNIVNNGVLIPFPSNGWQEVFKKEIKKLLFEHQI